jgi:hypothetical protein
MACGKVGCIFSEVKTNNWRRCENKLVNEGDSRGAQ